MEELCRAKKYNKVLEMIVSVEKELEIYNFSERARNRLLLYACYYGYINIVKILIEHKVCLNAFTYIMHTRLNDIGVACVRGNREIVELLIQHGAKIYDIVFYHICRNCDSVENLKIALQYIDKRRVNHYFVFQYATSNSLEILKCLVDHGFDINAGRNIVITKRLSYPLTRVQQKHLDYDKESILLHQCRHIFKKKTIELLLNAGARVDKKALYYARNKPIVMDLLIKHGPVKNASVIFPILGPDSILMKKLGQDMVFEILREHFGHELVIVPSGSSSRLLLDVIKMKTETKCGETKKQKKQA